MATIFRRKLKTKTTYRVQVRRQGFKTLVKTFNTRGEATKWGRHMENNLDKGLTSDFSEASRVMIRDLFKRYLKEHKNKHKIGCYIKEVTHEKPRAEYYIDDKGIKFDNNWEEILEEVL